ncbi:MAG TPA: NADH-quinone oxidoreductase subunit M [Armatimonadota bacterium]|nr:NADH-quinone oxidoreductase subunit M [Armatimonadota bacterium]
MLLTLLVFCPLLGAALAAWFGLTGRMALVKRGSILFSLVPLGLSCALWAEHLQGPAIGITTGEIDVPWIPILNSHYHMGVDGISLILVVLTTLLTTLALIFAQRLSDTEASDRTWQFYAMFFLLEVGMIGVFVSLDLVLFFLFWEVSLIPMYFIILLWGGPQREGAALKFILYTLVGSAGILVAFAALYLKTQTTDMVTMIAHAQHAPILTGALGAWVFWLLWIGFAIKVPVFPFHTWLPLAHVEAPTEGSVILAAILLKMGVYGMIRICLQIMPQQFHAFSAVVAWLGAFSVIYGALCAMAQTDLKKLVAYSSINHMGFCTLAVAAAAAMTPTNAAQFAELAQKAHAMGLSPAAFLGFRATALDGAVIEMVAHGLITGAMFFLVGVIYERAHHRDLRRFGGLWTAVPLYGGVMLYCTLASLGLPLLIGFVGEFLAFIGSYPIFQGAAIFSCFGLILAACYWLWMLQRLLYGPLNPQYANLPDMNGREKLAIYPLMGFILVLGLVPRLILDMINTASLNLFGAAGVTMVGAPAFHFIAMHASRLPHI